MNAPIPSCAVFSTFLEGQRQRCGSGSGSYGKDCIRPTRKPGSEPDPKAKPELNPSLMKRPDQIRIRPKHTDPQPWPEREPRAEIIISFFTPFTFMLFKCMPGMDVFLNPWNPSLSEEKPIRKMITIHEHSTFCFW